MSFASPTWLLALLLVPLTWALSEVVRMRAKRYAVRFTAVSTLRQVAVMGIGWRRHVPPTLLLLAIAVLALALARPRVTDRIPIGRASIMLVTDHSGSMKATDVAPTRLAAADRAARTFIGELPSLVRVGVVTFSTEPDTVLAPTSQRNKVLSIIDAQQAVGATATGDALQTALALLDGQKGHPPSAIVLISDGAANAGRNPVEVASEAARQKIPIYTVSLGKPGTSIPDPEDPLVQVEVSPDPELLSRIAQTSHGRTFAAQDASQLQSIYKSLASRLATKAHRQDVTVWFVIAGLLLLVIAAGLSLRWSGRLP